MSRKPIPESTVTEVLTKSARRCCICFGLYGKRDIAPGQIAHLDHYNSNNNINNLAYLCLECHDRYDSRTSQSKGYTIDEVKHYRESLYEYVIALRIGPGSERVDIPTFLDLAKHIWPLLADNARAFRSFGPNSSSESAAPVRWNLQLWEVAKREVIMPNNRKILQLLKDHYELIPHIHRPCVDQEISHIYAFEKHCEDLTLDYTENRFPVAFFELIDSVCVQQTDTHKAWLDRLNTWLLLQFERAQLKVLDAYLIGSALRGIFSGADVDIFMLLAEDAPSEIWASIKSVELIRSEFQTEFGLPLHTIVFTNSESDQFYAFLGNLTQVRKMIQ